MMNALVEQRQQAQLHFQQGEQNIVVGNAAACPLPPEQLASLDIDSEYVVEVFDGGLTAVVLHLCINGRHYNLKRRRPKALVHNVDGETSFLNEVQRRRDIQALKDQPATAKAFTHVVTTLYANYRLGFILSPWIDGKPLCSFSREIFRQIFATQFALEQAGLMEWDLSPGNIIYDGRQIHLFDFGYMYTYNPLEHYNSDGLDAPAFHAAERLETRNVFGYLLRYQDVMTAADQLAIYRELKEAALDVYTQKLIWLKQRYAQPAIIQWQTDIIERWEYALDNERSLKNLFVAESFRSHCLDIADDISGKSCTPMTLKRIDKVITMAATVYLQLQNNGALLFDNASLEQVDLIKKYQDYRSLAAQYQQK
ncbi:MULTISPECIES: phosphotransferase [unclassified Agarivorans]|uniref:phosphotransferase n=1 Tax=unclassified Agarivorans TaxID=2636026 RepID=UPI0026E12862|nr:MULTISPECIES: phosphotransferase [unclassified Agarivorans]MDO6686564.1 phosphotransferase [Agarivorans sp. 3_MG-2023]MDO6715382.1 phosphotransferase [Agarivorans sp. 2_MG-2023]MDO6763301.1 phosphotransferase [Agarivorans sp. 1_MG-2023]